MRSAADVLAAGNPALAYRRSQFEARLLAASPQDMVIMCLDDLLASLVRFEHADRRGQREARSAALTRCITSLTVLEMGVDHAAPLGPVLLQFYTAAKTALLGMMVALDATQLATIKTDFEDVRRGLAATD